MTVWDRPPRKERSTLTVDQILQAAVALLDEEGIEALSMRKLAARLGVGATSLYWHVKNRDELVVLIIDAVHGEIAMPDDDPAQDWREVVSTVARDVRSTMVRHPWLVSVLDQIVAANLGPNVSRLSERLLAVFERAGFELWEAEKALKTVMPYVTAVAMMEAAFHTWLARHGTTEAAWLEEANRSAKEITQEHPRLRELTAAYRGADVQASMDEDFEYGLARVLDGLQARLAAALPTA
jgi:AcrR family transcriptional regulator